MTETVLITGASSGIGWELAHCFAADGSRLVLVARNTAALESLAQTLRQAHGIEVIVLTFDLAQPESPKRILAELSARKITVDVLVNNAGFGACGAFSELAVQGEIEMVQVNITALMELTARLLPAMLGRNQGGILNVGSVAGFLPGPNMAVYYATKAFVQSFTEALAEELRGSKLVVSVLCPGPTETNFGKVARGSKIRERNIAKMTAKEVAVQGHRAFRNGKVIIITGFLNRLLVLLVRFAPRWFPRRIVAGYNRVK